MSGCKPQRPLKSTLRQPLKWLAIGLLLFAQVSLAAHYHEANDLASHECAVCTQLHSVEHTTVHTEQPLVPARVASFYFHEHTDTSIVPSRLLPPSRAPPLRC